MSVFSSIACCILFRICSNLIFDALSHMKFNNIPATKKLKFEKDFLFIYFLRAPLLLCNHIFTPKYLVNNK